MDEGLALPGYTLVSTDSHANILGAIGAFGQGMGDRDIAAAWARGSVWFKVPESVKISFTGDRPANVSCQGYCPESFEKVWCRRHAGICG